MTESDPQPPPMPNYAHPELAGRVRSPQPDGSLWRWTGSEWEMIDPPSTHQDVIRYHHVVAPLFALATRLAREGVPKEEAIARMWKVEGCSEQALDDTLELLRETSRRPHLDAEAACELVTAARERGTTAPSED